MRIYIKEEKHRFHILLPTGLVFNRFTATFAPKALEKQNIHITASQARKLFKAVSQYRRTHKDWVLAEVDASNGAKIFVKL